MKRFLITITVLFIGLFLLACNSSASQILTLAEGALKEASAQAAFLRWDAKGLKNRIGEQARSKKEDAFNIEIDVGYPDVSSLTISDLAPELPARSLCFETPDLYQTNIQNVLHASISSRLESCPTKNAPLLLACAKQSDGWSVTLDQAGLQQIEGRFKKQIDEKAAQLFESMPEAKLVQATKNARNSLDGCFLFDEFAQKAIIKNIELDAGGGYQVELSYPDTKAVLENAGAAYMDQLNGPLFKPYADGWNDAQFDHAIANAAGNVTTFTSGTLSFDKNGVPQTEAFLLSQSAALQESKAAIGTNINDTKLIKPVDTPKTGVIIGESTGRSIRINPDENRAHYYIKFFKLPSASLQQEGTLALSVFIQSGQSTSIKLPNGYYKMKYGVGSTWYGSEYAFGDDGEYVVSDLLIDVESGYSYTLTLKKVQGGNLPTSPISSSNF